MQAMPFSCTAGELGFAFSIQADYKTIIRGDINGDGHADFTITLFGNKHLTAEDLSFDPGAHQLPKLPSTDASNSNSKSKEEH